MKLNAALATLAIVGSAALPVLASAQNGSRNRDDRFQRDRDEKNDRRNDRKEVRNAKKNDWRKDDRKSESDRRQDTKNQWRNVAIGSALVGLLGLLKHDNTLTFAGAAGTLYSLDRYEKDRKSQNKLERGRADIFSRDHFDRNGVRYDRKTVTKNGQRYYQFQRSR